MLVGKSVKEGITVTIHSRGVSDNDIDALMYRLSFNKIKKDTSETGVCLVSYSDGLGAEIRRTKSGYVINLLKEHNDNG